ncbi:MAG: methyltransferase domain-containing protein [Bacteroidota bacterium]
MKIHHSSVSCFLLLLLLVLWGCHSDPIAERNATPPVSDTSSRFPSFEELSKEQYEKLKVNFDPPGRSAWQKPEQVLSKIKNIENKVVADVGAGYGYFARRLAQHAKRVIALDIDEAQIAYMDSVKQMDLKPEYQQRFETRLVTPTDSKLKPNEVDAVLIVNTYILFNEKVEYLKHLYNVMPEGGQIIIVDFKRKRLPIDVPTKSMRMELYKVENDLEDAGFFLIESDDCSLEYQYIVVAEK